VIVCCTGSSWGAISDNGNKYFDAVTKDHKPGKNLKVEFIVNGVSLSVRELFDRMEKHMDKSVDEKAHEMVSHFFDEHLDKIKEMFDDAFEDTFTKKGD